MKTQCLQVIRDIEDEVVPDIATMDELIWMKLKSGQPTVKEMYEMLRMRDQKTSWGKSIWRKVIPPKYPLFVCK